jgi:formamidopyrimidine-DNA glycosylase
VPELPEVEIAARRLDTALSGAEVDSALAPGMVALKSVKPPLEALAGREITGVRRIGKMPIVDFGPEEEPLSLLVHMMSAGRLQLFAERASLRDRRSRVLVRLADGRELRLREFGTKQRAWAKLMPAADLAGDEMVATLGPEAWPAPSLDVLAEALDQPRHLHPLLRDQRTIAGIGRSWVDEVLWEARLSPFKKGADLSDDEVAALHDALAVLGRAIDHYEEVIGESIPDKMPMPLQVHRREGEPCPRCGETIAAIHYSERITCYCPREQTGGRILADRRLSRLLK